MYKFHYKCPITINENPDITYPSAPKSTNLLTIIEKKNYISSKYCDQNYSRHSKI